MTPRRLHVLYTGGTIGMAPGPRGYAPAPGLLGRSLARSPQFHAGDPDTDPSEGLLLKPDEGPPVRYTIQEYVPLLDSANMAVDDWVRLAEDIARHHDEVDGFVVLHGTDTMAYTASALSFMLEGLGRPVVITGSQIPFCRMRNDAQSNLLGALTLAAEPGWAEVGVYFHHRLLRGNRVRKMDSEGLDAFASGNHPPLAEVGIDIRWGAPRRPSESKPLSLRPITERHVAAVRVFPGLTARVLDSMLQPPLQGVVLETYGAGNIPDRRADLVDVLRGAHDRGVVLTQVTQCHRGRVRPDYEAGRVLRDLGVVGAGDMTPECALVKLAWLLSREELDRQGVEDAMARPLRGELTPEDAQAPG